MTMTADAPRFQAYWRHLEGHSVLTMPRSDWDKLRVEQHQPVRIDIAKTPLVNIARDAMVVTALAEQKSDTIAEITIFRYDEQDAPMSINVDRYKVWLDVSSKESLADMISAASTELNQNFLDFVAQYVFLVKEDPGSDHWLPSLPASLLHCPHKHHI